MSNWLDKIGSGVFVTATDTGVGKTAVGGALARVLSDAGRDVGVMKPVASGCSVRRGELFCEDAEFLRRAARCDEPIDMICPIRLRAPLAPDVAARLEGRRIDLRPVWRAYASLRRRHECVIVEGAGGLLVPITDRTTMADLAEKIGLPLVVVVRPSLGTINHTMLTVEAARRRGLSMLGLVVNRFPQRPGLAERTNPEELMRRTGLPVLAILREDRSVSVAAGRLGSLQKQLLRASRCECS